jgi:hypothetical protein
MQGAAPDAMVCLIRMAPLASMSGQRLQAFKTFWQCAHRMCIKDARCKKGLATGKKYGCILCAKTSRQPTNVFVHVVNKKNRKCQCHMWGSYPMRFNKKCRFRTLSGQTKN